MDRSDALVGLALAVALVLVGLLDGLLSSAGLDTLATIVWPVGYGTVVLVAWYVWIRPLDLRAPEGEGDEPA